MDNFEIERACERLVLDFAYFSDRQEYESLSQLFAVDGIMERPNGESLMGPEAILRSYQSRPAGRITRHVCTNIRITAVSEKRARGSTYAVLYFANTSEPADGHFGFKTEPRHMIGDFEDEFVLSAEGWRFALRRARFVMHT